MNNVVKFLSELVALPSVNPACAKPGDPLAGEQRVAEFLAASAAHAGLEIEFREASPNRANLLATLRPTGKAKRRVLLAPHMDTVPAADPIQFKPKLANGRLYGRGACDTKGSVAAMFVALSGLAKAGARPKETEIVLTALVDEEIGQTGSRALAKDGLKADLAIVGEPTLLKVVTAHKGDLWIRLVTHGLAAHGANPHLGRNAVHTMARIITLLETEYAAKLRERPHPLLGCGTINIGTIHGGVQPNIVPDRCQIDIDRRTLPGETERGVHRDILALLRREGLRAELLDAKGAPCLPMETSADLPLVRQMLAAAKQREPLGVQYFCDASVFSCAGIPSVVFGPGSIAQAHTRDEWIAVEQLERGVRFLDRFLRALP